MELNSTVDDSILRISNICQLLNDEIPSQEKRGLVMKKDNSRGWTALHHAIECDASIEVISRLISIGGRELVMEKDFHGGTALLRLLARKNDVSVEIFLKLVETGGKDLVMEKDRNGMNALHWACWKRINKVSINIISNILEIGGRELVMEKDSRFGYTALHYEVYRGKTSIERVLKLIETGGMDLIMEKDRYGRTVLHTACKNHLISFGVISKLVEIGGSKLVTEKDSNGNTALYSTYFGSFMIPFNETFELLVKIAMQDQTLGEFQIGGLFGVEMENVQKQIYRRWEELAPTLERVISSSQEKPHILHAAIISGAPTNVIRDIVTRFNCTLTHDSMNRYAVDVAMDVGLKWNEGMELIIQAMAVEQNRPAVYVAAYCGLKWEDMRYLLEDNSSEIENGKDPFTGLFAFMLAAGGDRSDLSSIYGLMRMNPGSVRVDYCS